MKSATTNAMNICCVALFNFLFTTEQKKLSYNETSIL